MPDVSFIAIDLAIDMRLTSLIVAWVWAPLSRVRKHVVATDPRLSGGSPDASAPYSYTWEGPIQPLESVTIRSVLDSYIGEIATAQLRESITIVYTISHLDASGLPQPCRAPCCQRSCKTCSK